MQGAPGSVPHAAPLCRRKGVKKTTIAVGLGSGRAVVRGRGAGASKEAGPPARGSRPRSARVAERTLRRTRGLLTVRPTTHWAAPRSAHAGAGHRPLHRRADEDRSVVDSLAAAGA